MEKYKLHEAIKMLSENVYAPDNFELPDGWKLIKYVPNSKTGFQGAIYKNGNDIVVIYAGTNQAKDFIGADFQMGILSIPNQQQEAHNLYLEAKRMYPYANITLGGHSLGASLAQIESAHTGAQAVTFNAYGTGDILRTEGYKNIKDLNIINYGNPLDIVFCAKYDAQPGRTFITNTNLNPSIVYGARTGVRMHKPDINNHYLSRMNSLKNAVEVTESDIFPKSKMLQGHVYKINDIYKDNNSIRRLWRDIPLADPVKNQQVMPEKLEPVINQFLKQNLYDFDYSGYLNPATGDGKIFSREAISQMTGDEYAGNESAIMAQLKSIGIPYESDLELASMRGGRLVYVRPYTREDGTEVRGYWRSAPTV